MAILRFLVASLTFFSTRAAVIVTFEDSEGEKRVRNSFIKGFCRHAGSCNAWGNPDQGGLAFALVDDHVPHDVIADFKKEFVGVTAIQETSQKFMVLDVETDDQSSDQTLPPGATAKLPWGLDRIDQRDGQDGKYDPGLDGKGVHVYVVDSGIRTTHSEFEGRAVPAIDTTDGSVKVCTNATTTCAADTNGHGTHVAGTVGGKDVGVAPGVMLHAVKVLSDRFGWTENLMPAFDWLMVNAQRPAVIQMSLGSPGLKGSTTFAKSDALDYAITAASSSFRNSQKGFVQGMLTVVAGGNVQGDACQSFPANVEAAMTVAATGGRTSKDVVASYSNYGKCVDIFAPGDRIMSASHQKDDAYTHMSGTSMAAPHVAGAAAIVLSMHPGAGDDVAMVAKRIKNAGTPDALKGPDKIWDSSDNLLLYVSKFWPMSGPDRRRRDRRRAAPVPVPPRRRAPLRRRRDRRRAPPRRRAPLVPRRRSSPDRSLEDRVRTLEALVRSQTATINDMVQRLSKLEAPPTRRRRGVSRRRRQTSTAPRRRGRGPLPVPPRRRAPLTPRRRTGDRPFRPE